MTLPAIIAFLVFASGFQQKKPIKRDLGNEISPLYGNVEKYSYSGKTSDTGITFQYNKQTQIQRPVDEKYPAYVREKHNFAFSTIPKIVATTLTPTLSLPNVLAVNKVNPLSPVDSSRILAISQPFYVDRIDMVNQKNGQVTRGRNSAGVGNVFANGNIDSTDGFRKLANTFYRYSSYS